MVFQPPHPLHPAGLCLVSGCWECPFYICGFQSCSRKQGRLDLPWHNILQPVGNSPNPMVVTTL